ncbi:ERF superfamily protein [Haloechinothrix alba]|uniref:ERF superfamily protein n=1 Tax=Haloechinothrix alba TaxID=664784 RepID=A0A238WDC7_9PSEU|nr:ERF family protein [Haloechinothrix alba]SNR44596.1 ERF superfamily protein [Haloechinothrix alba]
MTDTLTVQQALVAVMRDVRALEKGDRNNYAGFNFRGIDATLNAIGPALRDHGVVVLPEILDQHGELVEVGKDRSRMRMVTVQVRYTFVGPGGDSLVTSSVGEAMDSGDKAAPKAMSVAMRTALLQTFALPTQEKDPDEDTYEHAPSVPAQPASQPRQERTKADAARDSLLEHCTEKGLEPPKVAEAYAARHNTSLREETNADNIIAFMNDLEADPDKVLGRKEVPA